MNIVIYGTGYVGQVTGACLANYKNRIILVDIDPAKVKTINKGVPTIIEQGLDKLIATFVSNNTLEACLLGDEADCIKTTQAIFITVGTPYNADGSIDLSQINHVAKHLGNMLKLTNNKPAIIMKSTVIPGTTDNFGSLLETTSNKKRNKDFYLAMNPEFLREGRAVSDFLHPDSIVFGGDKQAVKILKQLYSWAPNNVIKIVSNTKTAESIKYFKNTLLATKIYIANLLANYCETQGIDYMDVKPAIESIDAPYFFCNGPGFGGSCFPKDISAINKQTNSSLLSEILKTNDMQALHVLNYSLQAGYNPRNEKVCVDGLAFKPGTDDVRESPALKLIKALYKNCKELFAYDPLPEAVKNAKRSLEDLDITYARTLEDAIASSTLHYVMTNWPIFLSLKNIQAPVFFTHREYFINGKTKIINPDIKNKKYCLGSPLKKAPDYNKKLTETISYAKNLLINTKKRFALDFKSYFNSINVNFSEVVNAACMDKRLNSKHLI